MRPLHVQKYSDTVDGSEIRRSPVDREFNPLLTGSLTSQVPGGADFFPSTVIIVSHPMFFFIVIPLQGSRTTHTPPKEKRLDLDLGSFGRVLATDKLWCFLTVIFATLWAND